MKKIYNLLLIPAFAGMISCSGGGNRENDRVMEFRPYQFDAIAQIIDMDTVRTDGGDYCRVSGQGVLPVRCGNLDISLLQDSLTRLAEVIVVDKNLVQPALDNELELTQKDPESTEACSVMVNELSVDLVTPQLAVWKDYSYFYPCGAAHGMYSTTYVNFSIDMGKILSLSDIFKPGYVEELEKVLREKVTEMNVPLLVDINEVTVPSDFRITTHSVDFIYSLYEIAPYSEGEIMVSLPRYEIDSLFAEGAEEKLFGPSFD